LARKTGKLTEAITPPGTLKDGDVMRAENHYFIGLSARTNEEGAWLITALSKCRSCTLRAKTQ